MLTVDPSYYQHPLDKKSLAALKAIPGFTPLIKAFMKVFSERQYFIMNNSTNLRLGPKQIPEVYDLLPPIAERLGIPEPRLYLQNSRDLNAYTYGEHEPFIVLHSGLLETEPLETIKAVIAHECGHIACHHVLYRTMGSLILNGAIALLPGLGGLVSYALQIAFMEWMRCSEFSADRAAALAMGGSDPVVQYCTVFAGAYSSLDLDVDLDEFLNQATDYEQAIQASKANKAFEFLMYSETLDHPLNAYRALSIKRWCDTPEFIDMNNFLDSQQNGQLIPGSDPYALPSADAPAGGAPDGPEDGLDSPDAPGGAGAPAKPARFCMSCGSPLREGARFCERCGSPIG